MFPLLGHLSLAPSDFKQNVISSQINVMSFWAFHGVSEEVLSTCSIFSSAAVMVGRKKPYLS